jgi:hypothetical protein
MLEKILATLEAILAEMKASRAETSAFMAQKSATTTPPQAPPPPPQAPPPPPPAPPTAPAAPAFFGETAPAVPPQPVEVTQEVLAKLAADVAKAHGVNAVVEVLKASGSTDGTFKTVQKAAWPTIFAILSKKMGAPA